MAEIKSIAYTYIEIQKRSKDSDGLVLFDYTLTDLNNIIDKLKKDKDL